MPKSTPSFCSLVALDPVAATAYQRSPAAAIARPRITNPTARWISAAHAGSTPVAAIGSLRRRSLGQRVGHDGVVGCRRRSSC